VLTDYDTVAAPITHVNGTPTTSPESIDSGLSAFLGWEGVGGDPCRRREPQASARAGILDKDVPQVEMSSRKWARLVGRFSEVEYFAPELVRCGNFITLTSAKPISEVEAQKGWDRAQKWLVSHGYDKYVVTSGIQEKRLEKYGDSVRHYHLIDFGHRWVDCVGLRKAWGLGGTKHKAIYNVMGLLWYLDYLGKNGGRLSWSGALLKRIPGGAKRHSTCVRYCKGDLLNGFPGGVINFGWGNVREVREGYSFVPALGRVVPSVATTEPSQLWTAYRMSIDWEHARERVREGVDAENAWIKNWRLSELVTESALPVLQRTL
jgi:hypothetical protein